MIAGLIVVHTHIVLSEHFYGFFNCARPVKEHTHRNCCEDVFLIRILLFCRFSVKFKNTDSESVFVYTVKKEIRQGHKHRQV